MNMHAPTNTDKEEIRYYYSTREFPDRLDCASILCFWTVGELLRASTPNGGVDAFVNILRGLIPYNARLGYATSKLVGLSVSHVIDSSRLLPHVQQLIHRQGV